MPRLARRISKTNYYHVMVRGINKKDIFKKNIDKDYYIQMIDEKSEDSNCVIYAYAIMRNHAHILVKSDIDDLSVLMKKINVSFAMRYNTILERVGSVFQDRFLSETIDDEKHFWGTLRYIHNNPVKANLVDSAELYSWSSMESYLGKNSIIGVEAREEVFQRFNDEFDFINFHYIEDKNIYLDQSDEQENARIKKAEQIMVNNNDKKNEEVVRLIKSETDLSYRKIAKLMGVSVDFVFKAVKR